MLIPHHGVRPTCHRSVFVAKGAMVIRDLGPGSVDRIRTTAENHIGYARSYRAG